MNYVFKFTSSVFLPLLYTLRQWCMAQLAANDAKEWIVTFDLLVISLMTACAIYFWYNGLKFLYQIGLSIFIMMLVLVLAMLATHLAVWAVCMLLAQQNWRDVIAGVVSARVLDAMGDFSHFHNMTLVE